jgi:CRP-like cAMP-binding protein
MKADRARVMPPSNKLLAKLPRQELEAVSPDLEPVQLPMKHVMHSPFELIEHVFFLTRGVASLVNETETGDIVEFATVGPEGMVGFPIFLGTDSVPSRAIMQVPGEALRMKGADLERALPRTPTLRRLLLRYTMALLNQIAQGTACNRLHEVQERCARWLLQTHDRVDGEGFPLTQEFLSQMLGVHRPTVSVAAGMLQKAGLIEYTRGHVAIVDCKGLERRRVVATARSRTNTTVCWMPIEPARGGRLAAVAIGETGRIAAVRFQLSEVRVALPDGLPDGPQFGGRRIGRVGQTQLQTAAVLIELAHGR